MSARLAALAAQYVGRRVLLHNGLRGTVVRVTAHGLTVKLTGIRREDVARFLDD